MSKHTPERWTIENVRSFIDEEESYVKEIGLYLHEDLSDRHVQMILAAPEMLELLREMKPWLPDDDYARVNLLLARIDGDEEADKSAKDGGA